MKKYQTVIFDLDGTLLDTLADLTDATNAALRAYAYPERTAAEVRRFVGNGVRQLMVRALPQGEDTPRFAEILATFKVTYAAHCRDKTAPYPGLLPLLGRLRASGVQVAVVSNKFDAAVRDLCDAYFSGLIDVAVGESPGVARKPAPDTVLRAMARLQAAPESTVYVGDSEVDVETARRAGIPCVSVLWGFRERETLAAAGATCYAQDTAELEALL